MTATTFSRQNVTRDQAQFERFSYILSNGYRWCYLKSETKIEPNLRLAKMTLVHARALLSIEKISYS